MTNDKLERFIIENRDEFDSIEPSEKLWGNISENIPDIQKNVSKHRNIYSSTTFSWITRVAAAVIIFIGSYYFHDYRTTTNEVAMQNNEQGQNSELYNTLREAEFYYTSQIGIETEKLYGMTVGNSAIRGEIQDELNELDEEFQRLKEDLSDNAANEEIIAAMIQNYRLKLRILQDMMLQLQQDNNKKNSSDELIKI